MTIGKIPKLKRTGWILLLALAITSLVYTNGLNGPFLFDDSTHITQNRWVKIESLGWSDLARAWNSSFSAFPSSRPLAQLSFGINHALAGLNPWAFKATNLAIHLASGLVVFVFVSLAYRAMTGGTGNRREEHLLALATAAVWLLHPIHVSTVLYTVQRMTQLSSISLLAALSCYFWGRLQIAGGRSGTYWVLAAAPIALLGFLGKENAVLLPLLLLVSEVTLLRDVSTANRRVFIRIVWALFIAAPLIIAAAYFATHPGLFIYEGRPFTLEERLLTQPRVLWFYLRLLLIPDVTAFGLFHDDLQLSTNLLNPRTTILAIVGLIAVAVAAVIMRRRAPVFAFSVLFFLVGHILESSALPLEMVFEHRNYLASLGPLLYLAYQFTVRSKQLRIRPVAITLGSLLLLGYVAVTFVRVENWSSYEQFVSNAAANHPKSARSNFMAAKLLISAIGEHDNDASELADLARDFLDKGLAADERCINCMFGLLVLDLHLGKKTDPVLIEQLRNALRSGYVGPTKASVSNFSYLVKWQRSDGFKLPREQLESIFDAALSNPAWRNTGRAGIEAAYRKYFEFVTQDYAAALKHGKAAIRAWPAQWSYRIPVVRLLYKLGRCDEARSEIEAAAPIAGNHMQQQKTAEIRAKIMHDCAHWSP